MFIANNIKNKVSLFQKTFKKYKNNHFKTVIFDRKPYLQLHLTPTVINYSV